MNHTYALMSLISLQTALFETFGQEFEQQKLMNTLTGAVVCLMTVLGSILGMEEPLIPGIIGVLGIAIAAYAYPLYRRILLKEREKVGPEILRLTEELIK